MQTKKILALIMAMMMCFTLIPSYVSAADTVTFTAIDGKPGNDPKAENYTNLFDGKKTSGNYTKYCVDMGNVYVVARASEAVVVKGYTFTTGNDSQGHKGRNPKSWVLYGSNNYDEDSKEGVWEKIHSVANDTTMQDANFAPFSFTFNNEDTYRYYKFEFTEDRGANLIQLCEIEFDYNIPGQVSFKAVKGKETGNGNENYTNLFDGKKTSGNYTKYCVDMGNVYVVARASEPAVVTGYTFTTGNDNQSYKGRNPKSWVLYGSNNYNEVSDEGTWTKIHSVTNDTKMQDVNFTPFSFTFNNEEAYQYYKFEFAEVQGEGVMQLCEIEFEYTVDIHKWEEISRTEPTCTEVGGIYEKCTECNKERIVEISALGHDFQEESRTEPTCTKIGYSYQKCSRCEETKTVELPLIDHNWQKKSGTEPTCFESGHIIEYCTICNTQRESDFPPLGHIKGDDGKCSRCNEYIIKVGSNYYCDLQEAVNAAALNEVVMLQNVVIQNTLTIGTRTLDLNGFTLKKINSGRVINVSGDFTLKDSSKNHTGKIIGGSDADGGGVYVGQYDTFNMQGGTISECSATNDGGGVYVCENAKFNMSDGAVIENCTAGNYGGGIKNINSTVTITNGKIVNCTATVDGGGIYAGDSSIGGVLIMSDSTVENCTAVQNGGGGIFAEKASVTLTNCNVNENNAKNYAGGVYARNGSILKMEGCTVRKNTVDNSGGGVFAGGAIADLKNCNVNENDAKDSGGGVATNGAELILENTQITKNTSSGKGGGIYTENNSKLTVTKSYIQENTTSVDGGGIYANNVSSISFNSGSIEGNSAQWGGGVYLYKGSDMTVSDGSITNNTAADSGGGVYLYKGSGMTISGGSITNNTAANNGGGIILNDFATVLINGEWTNKRPTLTMTGGNISHNEALGNDSNGNGGGIYGQKKAVINISGGVIDCNKAANGGGIALFDNSALSLSGKVDISQNTARLSGGGVYINNQSNMTLSGISRITQNNSSCAGSGIYADGGLSISGAPQVNGNEIILSEDESGKTNAVRSNIYLPSGKTISASDIAQYEGGTGSIAPSLYFTAEDGTADITGNCEDFSEYFFSDNIDYAVAYKDGVIKLLTGHKVTFVYDEERNDVVSVVDGHTVQEADGEPHKEGYAFVGWLKDGYDYDFSTPVTEDITLTPKWVSIDKPLVSINYNKFYVSGLNKKAKVYIASYNNDGALIGMYSETISGDYSRFSFSKSFADVNFNTNGAKRITAFLWDENMQPLSDKAVIVFDCNVRFVYDEQGDIRTSTVSGGRTVREPEDEPHKEGYAFVGWLKDGYDYDFSAPVTEDITLTPKWVSTDKPLVSINYNKFYVSGLNKKAKVYIASYNNDGALIGIYSETISGDYSVHPFSKSFKDVSFNTDGAKKITAFLWDENMRPLSDKAFISLN